MSSDYSAGIPIKKRRYPAIHPSSPPTEEKPCRAVINPSLQQEPSSPSQKPVVSDSVEAIPSGGSDVKKDSPHEQQVEISEPMNVEVVHNSVRVKIEPNSIVGSVSRTDIQKKIEDSNPVRIPVSEGVIQYKTKLAGEESSNCLLKSAQVELKLAPAENMEKLAAAGKTANSLLNSAKSELKFNEASALLTATDLSSLPKMDRTESKITNTSDITELSLGLKIGLDSAMTGQNCEGSLQGQGSRESILLNFSMSKGESSNQRVTDDVKLKSDNVNKCANRSNWDLNTTMDSWDGAVRDEALRQVTHALIGTGEPRDVKPLISSVGKNDTTKEQIVKASNYGSVDTISPSLLSNPHTSDNLHLRLSSPFMSSHLGQHPSISSAQMNSSTVLTKSSLSKMLLPSGKSSSVNVMNVKAEPVEECLKSDSKVLEAKPKGSPGTRSVKCESIDRGNQEAGKLSDIGTLKLVVPGSVKAEPIPERIPQSLNSVEETPSQSDKQIRLTQKIGENLTNSAGPSSRSNDAVNCVEHALGFKVSHVSGNVVQEKSESSRQVSVQTSTITGQQGGESNVFGMIETAVTTAKKANGSEQCRIKSADGHESCGQGDICPSDEEKINLSSCMLEEDIYGSDYESDGNQNLGTSVDAELNKVREEDIEDGEVKQSGVVAATQGPKSEMRDMLQLNNDNFNKKETDLPLPPGDGSTKSSYVKTENIRTEEPDKTIDSTREKISETALDERTKKDADGKDAILCESPAVGMSADGSEKRQRIKAPLRQSIVMLGMKDSIKLNEQPSDEATNATRDSSVPIAQGSGENGKGDTAQKNVSILPKVEAPFNVDGATKDVNSGGNRRRIINLPRASNISSPGKSKVILASSLPSQAEKEKFDVTPKGDEAIDERVKKETHGKDSISQESLTVEMSVDGSGKKQRIKTPLRQSIIMLGMKDGLKTEETEQPSDQGTNASQASSVTMAPGSDENGKEVDVQQDVSPLTTVEQALNVDDAAKDASSGGNRRRIINLPRTYNLSSPSKSKVILSRSFPSQAGRDKYDVTLKGDTLHTRGRDEIYTDGPRKFMRERYEDRPSRNFRLNFGRGRGRNSSRIDTLNRNWNPDYCGPPEYRPRRHKFAAEDDHEFESYNVGMNGKFAGTGRGGRKLLDEDGPMFRHVPSRRRSPGIREGHPGCGIEMVRRVARNISPGRCIGEDGSELVGLRHGEKFMKGLHNDNSDPIYTHPQPSYVGIDGPFVQGNRNFLPTQRRGPIRSKSPVDRRAHPSGTWSSSPRRRSAEGFGRHPELPNQRSPPIYRMERMSSPDDPCFVGEMVVRGRGAPYMSRPSDELRDMDSDGDIGHHRPVVSNRSPSGRILLRNNRRFDLDDPHGRPDGDQYFARPMPSGRFQELAADGSREERRRFDERRGPGRPFRPSFNGTEGGEFSLNAEGGPRPFRLCPNNDSEFHERGNLREREFDRRIKTRPGNEPRRTRNIEEQDGNFRHGGQMWHDNGFDDMSRIKRKRF